MSEPCVAADDIATSGVRDAIFADNRARGHISLEAAVIAGKTRRLRVDESGSLRLRFPHSHTDALEGVIVNSAGGVAGGDRFSVFVAAQPHAHVTVTTAAAEKVYRASVADSLIDVRLRIAEGASVRWLPHETILFDRARLRRSIDVDLDDGASVLLTETVVFGRGAMGESVQEGALFDRWRVRRAGALIYAETVRLDGAIAQTLRHKPVADGATALAAVFLAPADETRIAPLRDIAFASEVGISSWNGFAIMRLVAKDAAAIRTDLATTLRALGEPLPRLWTN
jgi:urease accessory protein